MVPGQIQLSAWVQVGIGSVGGGEMDLNGVVGAIPKKQLLKLIEKIKQAFSKSSRRLSPFSLLLVFKNNLK